ncbi:kelch-like protein 2, partial [Aphis craccivora]
SFAHEKSLWELLITSRWVSRLVILNGLIHVIGERNKISVLNSIDIYNPKTNTWSLKTLSKDDGHIFGGVVVNKSPHFKTYDD